MMAEFATQKAPQRPRRRSKINPGNGDLGQPLILEPRTASDLLLLQTSAGNQAVTSLLQGRDGAVLQRDDAPQPDKDGEGNDVTGDGGKKHLTKVPPDCAWHKGKPEALPPNPKAMYGSLMSQCRGIQSEQEGYAASFRAGDTVLDMKYWFARVYSFVTKFEIEEVANGLYDYPLMKMQEVVGFEAIYKQNIENWSAGNKDNVDSNWKAAFVAAQNSTKNSKLGWFQQILTLGVTSTKSQDVMNALLPSMQAHIRFDLPRAIAAAYEANYAGIPGLSMGVFRVDFDKMGPVFDRANEALLPEIDGYTNRDVRPDPGSWHWLQGVGFPFMFNIPLERNQAWEKADAIVGGHEKGITDPAVMQERLQAYMTAAHPFSGSEAFEVDGNKVKDYPFGTAPPAE